MKLDRIDKGNEFDFGRTSGDYAAYRDIYPQSMYRQLIALGVGASLPEPQITAFENEYRRLLEKYDDPLQLKHQIHIELYRSVNTILN